METLPKYFCFVLMPFDKEFNDTYQLGIKAACADIGAYCERVDEQNFEGSILDRIYNQIAKADLIIADMSGRNPNVFYEAGYAHALGKPTLLLTQNASDIPFDMKHFQHIIYEKSITNLKSELSKRVEWFKENKNQPLQKLNIEFEIFYKDKNLSKEEVIRELSSNESPYFNLTLLNSSLYTFEPGSFKITIITSKKNSIYYDRNIISTISSTLLPDGNYSHIFPEFATIFPNEYCSFSFGSLRNRETKGDEKITIRIFTMAGFRDYKLKFRYKE